MKELQSGQHFGLALKKRQLEGTILTEAGYTAEIQVPWHYHENAYFFYHLNGHLDEVNKKKVVSCKPGTLLFHHWQDPHYDKNFSEDAKFFHIEIEKKWFTKFHVDPSALQGSMEIENISLKAVFRKIYAELRLNDSVTQLSVDGLLSQSFSQLLRNHKQEKSHNPGWVKKIRDILNDCYAEKISLQTLSKETGIHPVHLSREFVRYFGSSFGEYLRSLKVEKATVLLLSEDITTTEIAYRCGFSDQSHFIRVFKGKNGTTPFKYKRNILKGW